MKLIDTHTHIYLPEFDGDRDEAVNRAVESGLSNSFCRISIFILSVPCSLQRQDIPGFAFQ